MSLELQVGVPATAAADPDGVIRAVPGHICACIDCIARHEFIKSHVTDIRCH
jgi:hypothetical protein